MIERYINREQRLKRWVLLLAFTTILFMVLAISAAKAGYDTAKRWQEFTVTNTVIHPK